MLYSTRSRLLGLISDVYIDSTHHLNTEKSRYTPFNEIKKNVSSGKFDISVVQKSKTCSIYALFDISVVDISVENLVLQRRALAGK